MPCYNTGACDMHRLLYEDMSCSTPPARSRPRGSRSSREPHASGLRQPRTPRRPPHGHCHVPHQPIAGPPAHPRPYQYEAVAALLAASARGVQRPLLVLPTGTGKTIVFALLVQRRGGRALILAHRDELIQQAVDKLRLVDPSLPLGVVQAARDEHTAPVVVASVQTLRDRTRLT